MDVHTYLAARGGDAQEQLYRGGKGGGEGPGGTSPIAPSLRLSLPSGAAGGGRGGLSQPAREQNNSGPKVRRLGGLPGAPRALSGLALLLRSCQGEGFAQGFRWSDIHASQFALFRENNLRFVIPP